MCCNNAGGHPAIGVAVPVGGGRGTVAEPQRRASRGARAVALAVPAAARRRARQAHRARPAPHARPAGAHGQYTLSLHSLLCHVALAVPF